MPLTPKDWRDDPDHTTPITAAALEDLETRLGVYTDTAAATKADVAHTHPQTDVTGLVAALAAKQDTSAKGAANGYMALDANSRGAQPPAVHGTVHGRGGDDPLIGAAITDNTAQAAAHKFTLSPRTDATLTFAVPTVRAAQVNTQTAFDVMPNGTATPGGNGYAWIDVCDVDFLDGTYVGTTARFAIHSDHVEISSRGIGATAKRIDLGANILNNSQIPQIQINPGNSTLSSNFPTGPGNIQLAKDGSDLYLGRIASTLTAAATVGYTYLRMVTAPPTGVPSGVLSGSAAIAVDSTGKIWVYTSANAAWKSVATA